MKFLCPNCKAKYQISDEKIAGRTLKMDCRRCNHPIVIRGDALAAPAPEPDARRSATGHSTAGHSAAGHSTGHSAGHSTGHSAGGHSSSAHSSSAHSSSAHAAPRRRSTSHVGPAPARASSRSALGADFRKNASSPPAQAKPTALDQWHVAINDVPVGPMKRDEVAQKIAAGAIDKSSLVWREGLDDWRELHMVPELAALLRKVAAPPPPQKPAFPAPARGALGRSPAPARPARPPAGRMAPRQGESQRPAARGNVVPIGGRLGASAAPEIDDFRQDDFLDDEPTRVGSAVDFEALERDARAQEDEKRRATDEARHRAAFEEQQRAEEQRAERGRQAERRQAAAAVPAAPSASHEDGFDPFASQRSAAPFSSPSSPGAQPAPLSSPGAFAAPPASAPGFAPAQPYAQPAPVERRRRAIPIGAWIAIAGAMAFGVALAVMVGTRLLQQPPAEVATNVPAPVPDTPVGPELDVPEVPDVAETPTPDETPLVEDPAEATGGSNTGPRTPRTGAGSGTSAPPATTGGTNPAPVDPRFARFADDTAQAAEIAPRPTNPINEGRSGGGGGELNADQIRAVVTRERAGVQRCYETAARAAGQAPGLRLDVDVTIGGSGTVTSSRARGQSFGSLTECVERSVLRWRFPASGGITHTSIPFVFQGRD